MSYSQHGRRHAPGGTDMVGGGFIAYDWANVGDWLYIETSQPVDGSLSGGSAASSSGVLFDTTRGVGITNNGSGGGIANFVVAGGDTDDNVSISFGGVGGGSPFFLDGGDSLTCFLIDVFDVQQADGSGNNSELSLNGGNAALTGTGGIDIISNAGAAVTPFPIDFGINSVQIAAGDDTTQGTVVLEAFDNQATNAYTEFFVGYVDFNPNPYTYNGQTAQILGGQTFTVVGSDGSPIFQVLALEQGGTVHIKTGTTVHADL